MQHGKIKGETKGRQEKRKQQASHMFLARSDTQTGCEGRNGQRTASISSNQPGRLLGPMVKVWHGQEMSRARVVAGITLSWS